MVPDLAHSRCSDAFARRMRRGSGGGEESALGWNPPLPGSVTVLRMARVRPTVAAVLALLVAVTADAGPAEPAPPLKVVRAAGEIRLDGDLTDPGWRGAAVIDQFWETQPGDNLPPKAGTVAWVTYDDRHLYVALRCDDPDPSRIRAPFVERDEIVGTDDNVAVFLDTRGDGMTAIELRVNARGQQGDAIYNDASQNEDFSPDFFYDTAARVTESGWAAEMRIPFSSLRYSREDAQQWRILIWRNYPRDYRYFIHSRPIPRGSDCLICHAQPLVGLSGLPASGGLVLAPYASGQTVETALAPGAPLGDAERDGDLGVDVKWQPAAGNAIDATINPDFSQVEADVAQLAVNNRFALFYPEKRPFFMEGVELFDTPIQAVYTRTITSPRWGGRATGRVGHSSYAVLAADDRGGGSVILPGPAGSGLAPQDFGSLASNRPREARPRRLLRRRALHRSRSGRGRLQPCVRSRRPLARLARGPCLGPAALERDRHAGPSRTRLDVGRPAPVGSRPRRLVDPRRAPALLVRPVS